MGLRQVSGWILLATGEKNKTVEPGIIDGHQLLLALDGFVYWEFGNAVLRRSLNGSDPIATSVASAWATLPMSSLVRDNSNLYLSSEDGLIFGQVLEPSADATVETDGTWLLARDQDKITSMVVVGRKLYFVNDACQVRYVEL